MISLPQCWTLTCFLQICWTKAQLFHFKPKQTVSEHSIIDSSIYTQHISGLLLWESEGQSQHPLSLLAQVPFAHKLNSEFSQCLILGLETITLYEVFFPKLLLCSLNLSCVLIWFVSCKLSEDWCFIVDVMTAMSVWLITTSFIDGAGGYTAGHQQMKKDDLQIKLCAKNSILREARAMN